MIGVPVCDKDGLEIERYVDDRSIDQVILVEADIRAPKNTPDTVQFDDLLCHALCLLDTASWAVRALSERMNDSESDCQPATIEC